MIFSKFYNLMIFLIFLFLLLIPSPFKDSFSSIKKILDCNGVFTLIIHIKSQISPLVCPHCGAYSLVLFLDIVPTLREMEVIDTQYNGYITAYKRTQITDELHQLFGFRTDYEII